MNGESTDARFTQRGRAVALCAGLLLGLLAAAESFSGARRKLEPSEPQTPPGWRIQFRYPNEWNAARSASADKPRDFYEYTVNQKAMILRVRRLPKAADLSAHDICQIMLQEYAEEGGVPDAPTRRQGETQFGAVKGWKAEIDEDPSPMGRRGIHVLVAAGIFDLSDGEREAYTVELEAAVPIEGHGRAAVNAVLDSIKQRGGS